MTSALSVYIGLGVKAKVGWNSCRSPLDRFEWPFRMQKKSPATRPSKALFKASRPFGRREKEHFLMRPRQTAALDQIVLKFQFS